MRNDWVQFEIADVYFPEPAKILRELHGKDVLHGRVLENSKRDGFVVVQVKGLAEPVVVPAGCVRRGD